MIDLHAHTTASDGLLSPVQLAEYACERGVTVLAVTDHDTAAGARALVGRETPGLTIVSGIEISSSIGDSELHVLGYFVDPSHPRLIRYEDERKILRRARIAGMVDRLREAGYDVSMEEIDARGGGDGTPGRPHIARLLVEKGLAPSARVCFDSLFCKGGPAFVPYEKIDASGAAELIKSVGGVPIVAHPGLDDVEVHLDELIDSGMLGVEVWHSSHDAGTVARLAAYCAAHGMLATGGSDFHGVGKEGGSLGRTTCPAEAYEALRRAASGAADAPRAEGRRRDERKTS